MLLSMLHNMLPVGDSCHHTAIDVDRIFPDVLLGSTSFTDTTVAVVNVVINIVIEHVW
jgi:hypothetical protein